MFDFPKEKNILRLCRRRKSDLRFPAKAGKFEFFDHNVRNTQADGKNNTGDKQKKQEVKPPFSDLPSTCLVAALRSPGRLGLWRTEIFASLIFVFHFYVPESSFLCDTVACKSRLDFNFSFVPDSPLIDIVSTVAAYPRHIPLHEKKRLVILIPPEVNRCGVIPSTFLSI